MESIRETYSKIVDTVAEQLGTYNQTFKPDEDYAGVEVKPLYSSKLDFENYFNWLIKPISDSDNLELLPIPDSLFTIVGIPEPSKKTAIAENSEISEEERQRRERDKTLQRQAEVVLQSILDAAKPKNNKEVVEEVKPPITLPPPSIISIDSTAISPISNGGFLFDTSSFYNGPY